MAKIIIPRDNLADEDIYTEQFQVRFRVVSDNQNSFSYWSPIYSIDQENIFFQGSRQISGNVSLTKSSGTPNSVVAVWDSVSIYKIISDYIKIGELKEYDVWIRFSKNGGADPGDWIHKERVSTTSLNLAIPDQYEYGDGLYANPIYMYIEIYRPGRPVERYSKKTNSITQNSSSVDTTLDIITTPAAHGFNISDSIVYESSNHIGGLSSENIYWVRPESDTSFKIFENKSNAIDNTSPINLTSTGSGAGTFDYKPFLLYKDVITDI